MNRGPDRAIYGCSSLPSHARFWGLCQWGHDPFPGGRAARHLVSWFSCVLCSAPLGDLAHYLCEPSFCRSPSRIVQSGLCLVGLPDVLGSSFLDLQSQVFSELHDSHPCTCAPLFAALLQRSSQLSAVTPRVVFLVLQPSLGAQKFYCRSGSSATFLARVSGSTLRFQPVSFSQFVTLSVLSWM